MASRNDANGIKPESNSIISDKQAAEYSKPACLGVNYSVCDALITHKTI